MDEIEITSKAQLRRLAAGKIIKVETVWANDSDYVPITRAKANQLFDNVNTPRKKDDGWRMFAYVGETTVFVYTMLA